MDLFYGMTIEQLSLFGVSFVFILILLLISLSNRSKIKRLNSKYNRFMSGLSNANIEEVLEYILEKIDNLNEKNNELEFKLNNIERNMYHCIQKVGIVRYNAFDNVGSDLSFSIALLDKNDNGIVISSLYARDGASTYAKPVVKNKSKYALSAEELQAIDLALKTSYSNSYID
jgi:hypothetical protein